MGLQAIPSFILGTVACEQVEDDEVHYKKGQIMNWLNEFDHARKSGANTFLLTGNTGDVFPQYDADPAEHPRDRLDPLHVLCTRHVLNGNVTWIFDPASGFIFPREQDEVAMSEILKGNKPQVDTSQMNAVQRNAARLREKPLLPTKPSEAFAAMMTVFTTTSSSGNVTQCITVIPDVDAIAGRDDGMAGGGQNLLALQIIRFANTYAFQKAGHMLIMTAATTSCVDERLTRPDSPVTHVNIGRPNRGERLTYLQHVCADAKNIKQRIEDISKEIKSNITTVQEQATKKLAQLTDEKSHHEATLDLVQSKDSAYNKATKKEKKALAKVKRVRKKCGITHAQQIEEVETNIAELEARLESEVCATVQLTDENWKKFQVGDRIRWTYTIAGEPTVDENLVVKTLPGHRILISSPLPEGRNKTYCDGNKVPVEFSMRKNWLYGKRSNDEQTRPFTIAKDRNIEAQWYRIPAELETTEQALNKANQQLAGLIQASAQDHPEVKKAQQEADQATTDKAEALSKAMESWEETRRILNLKIGTTEQLLSNPTSETIEGLQNDLTSLQALIANIMHTKAEVFDIDQEIIPEAARLMQGFGYRDILNILRHVSGHNETFSPNHILARRMQILKRSYGDLLKIVEPAYGFEGIAGLKGIKQEFSHMRDLVLAGDYKRVPQGILLMGPPGTGKTAVVEAFAQECGMLFVTIQNEKVKWVGDSEKKTDMTKQALMDLAPVVVLRDEVDQVDQGRDSFNGDSGVSNYIRRSWMEFLSRADIRGRIIVISCTNRPDLLDAALTRDQRTDERIPVLMPDAETREELFHVMAVREGFKLGIANLEPYVKATDGLSGANIQKIVRKADAFAGKRGKDTIDRQALQDAIDDFIRENTQEDIARMSLMAIRSCSSMSYLPDNWEQLIKRFEKMTSTSDERRRLENEVRKKMSKPHTM